MGWSMCRAPRLSLLGGWTKRLERERNLSGSVYNFGPTSSFLGAFLERGSGESPSPSLEASVSQRLPTCLVAPLLPGVFLLAACGWRHGAWRSLCLPANCKHSHLFRSSSLPQLAEPPPEGKAGIHQPILAGEADTLRVMGLLPRLAHWPGYLFQRGCEACKLFGFGIRCFISVTLCVSVSLTQSPWSAFGAQAFGIFFTVHPPHLLVEILSPIGEKEKSSTLQICVKSQGCLSLVHLLPLPPLQVCT